MHYVAGFVFRGPKSSPHDEVALIEKAKPIYLRGCLNGIGGGVERGESALQAIVREVCEESGLVTDGIDWRHFVTLSTTREDRIDFFVTRYIESFGPMRTLTAEKVAWYPVADLGMLPVFKNLLYLIPLAIQISAHNVDYERLHIIETK